MSAASSVSSSALNSVLYIAEMKSLDAALFRSTAMMRWVLGSFLASSSSFSSDASAAARLRRTTSAASESVPAGAFLSGSDFSFRVSTRSGVNTMRDLPEASVSHLRPGSAVDISVTGTPPASAAFDVAPIGSSAVPASRMRTRARCVSVSVVRTTMVRSIGSRSFLPPGLKLMSGGGFWVSW